jgi:hypothetical protein
MKSSSVLLLSSILALQVQGQVITGKVLDASGGRPLAYVSIGVMGTQAGTITDEKGIFYLSLTGQPPEALVRFSMIGFRSQTFTVRELSGKDNIIRLKSEPVQLPEIVVRPSGRIKKAGITDYTRYGGLCGWGGTEIGKGHEIGTAIALGTFPVKLRGLHLHVYKQSFDSSLFRLHIRDLAGKLPGKELLHENIFIPVTNKSGWIDIDLSRYNLVFSGDIALSLEWIKVIGVNPDRLIQLNGSKQKHPDVLFNLKKGTGCTFTKWGTEADWKRTEEESPSFYLTVQE